MTPALTLLIASSVGWSSPQARPVSLEVELIVVSLEASAAAESSTVDPVPAAAAESPFASPLARSFAAPAAVPAASDPRARVSYDPALPWFRTKP